MSVRIVDVREINAGPDVEPLHWCLLTSHEVGSADDAWRIVEWYKQRWIIEQFFRVLKTQGLKLEDSQASAAIGQIALASEWSRALAEHGIVAGPAGQDAGLQRSLLQLSGR